jgi:hypothetical protein
VQPDGRILAIGRARLDDLTGYTVWARTPSGAPDPTFGNNGFARYVLDGEGPSAGALQGNQRLFMVGVNDAKVRVLSVKLQPDPLPVLPSSARATITSPTRSKLKRTKLTKISGTATATNGSVGSVEVAILKSGPKKSKSCRWVKDTKAKFRSVRKTKAGCKRHVWIKASGTTKWTLKLKKSLPIGKYTIYARATPAGGVPEASFSKALRNTRSIKLTR